MGIHTAVMGFVPGATLVITLVLLVVAVALKARLLGIVGLLLLVVCFVAFAWLRIIVYPFAAVGVWAALALLVRAWRLRRRDAGDAGR